MSGHSRRSAVALLVIGVLAPGCQSAGQRLTETAAERAISVASGQDVDLDVRDGRIEIETDEGSYSAGLATEIPDRIVAVVALPAGFEPLQTFEQREDDKHSSSVTGQLASADLEAVLDELEATLTGEGWEAVSRINQSGELFSLHLERGDANLNVSAIVDGDDAMLTLMLFETS